MQAGQFDKIINIPDPLGDKGVCVAQYTRLNRLLFQTRIVRFGQP